MQNISTKHRLQGSMALLASLACLLCLMLPAPAQAETEAEAVVRSHFEAILAENYKEADTYFSREFRTAFKGDIARMQAYYRTRMEQLKRGYVFAEVSPLGDADRETMRITVDFGDPQPEDAVDITERIFYYMIRQNSTDTDASAGKAWRIDIFEALSYESLSDARRRSYLYTGQEWDEFASRELIARQGLFRIQMALESFYQENRNYPFRLLGDDSRRDELISANKLGPVYPQCGFANRPMRSVHFEEKSSGDFSYYGYDSDGDESNDGYWLILHGRDESGFYFEGRDTIFILSNNMSASQREQAEGFAQYWESSEKRSLAITDVTEFILPSFSAGSQLAGAPATPSVDELASQINRADPISGNLETAGNMFEEAAAGTDQQAAAGSQPAEESETEDPTGLASQRALRIGNWIMDSAAGRLLKLFGTIAPSNPLATITVSEDLTVHSFGSWNETD
jgi:hypothetical protein